jgi:hypothetical protein
MTQSSTHRLTEINIKNNSLWLEAAGV